jgi:Zn-dependent protease/CBS domain-containing protein
MPRAPLERVARTVQRRGTTMFGKQISLFRLFGFEIKADVSWLFLAVLVTWSLASGWFPTEYPGLATATYWWMGVVGAIGIFFSLIFHELSHSLVARRYGLPIGGITLFLFGGVAEMKEEPANPKVEFWMAIAGPISSALLAIVFYGVAALGQGQGIPEHILGLVRYLGFLNGLLAAFNLVPAFPLDGGRVFRAALWHWKGDFKAATRIASNVGGAFSLVLMAVGALNVITGNFVGGMWWFLIGLFLRSASSASYRQLVTRGALEGQPIGRFMADRPIVVRPELTIHELVENYVYKYHHEIFPVVDGTHLIGCVTMRQIKEVPRDEWGLKTVSVIAAPSDENNTVDAREDAANALVLMQRTGNGRLMVTDGGRLVGIVALKDLLKVLALKMELEERS